MNKQTAQKTSNVLIWGRKTKSSKKKKITDVSNLGQVRDQTEGLQCSRGNRPWGVCRMTDGEREDMHSEDGAHADLVVQHLLLRQLRYKESRNIWRGVGVVKAPSARF